MRWLFCLLVAGCATEMPARPGPVVTEVGWQVRVCVDSGALREGSRVTFTRAACRETPKHMSKECVDIESGTGKVVRVLDERCALVEVSPDVDVRSGDKVALRP